MRNLIMILKKLMITLALCLLTTNQAIALQCEQQPVYKTAESFQPVAENIYLLGNKYGTKNVLLVFDIDNTLLTMPHNLGSDQWFEWQDHLLGIDPESPQLMVNDFGELLNAQALLWQLIAMKPTESTLPGLIKQFQLQGFTTLLLTSRGPENHDQTLKSLHDNNYRFELSALPGKPELNKVYLPYNRDRISDIGISKQHAIATGLGFANNEQCTKAKYGFKAPCFKKPRDAMYANGIFLTSGQHKGIMLQSLLHQTGFTGPNRFQAIVYVDDKKRHVERIYKTFCNTPTELSIFHYTHELPRVTEFTNSDKKEVLSKWNEIKRLLNSLNQ